MKKSILLSSVALLFYGTTAFGQGGNTQHWKLGGNPNTGIDAVNTTNNILGTVAGNNVPILFHTNGIGRMLITNGNTGVGAGRVAMGNNLPTNFTPRDRLHLHQDNRGPFIRFTNNNTGNTNANGFRVGINTNGHALLQNRQNTSMRFFTNNIQRLHVNETNGTTDGFVGIGNNFNTPQSQLHIHNEQSTETRLQITNQASTATANTFGLTLGIVEQNLFSGTQNVGYLRWGYAE
jgi:hypothetical protein